MRQASIRVHRNDGDPKHYRVPQVHEIERRMPAKVGKYTCHPSFPYSERYLPSKLPILAGNNLKAYASWMDAKPSTDREQRLSATSEAMTHGLRVRVSCEYLPDQSSPAQRIYAWAYHITLRNEGDAPCQLRSRHWIITDANARVEEVRGPGVIGEEPHLRPGAEFRYTSGCSLRTSSGTMRGTYQMQREDGTSFDADIATFALELPRTLN